MHSENETTFHAFLLPRLMNIVSCLLRFLLLMTGENDVENIIFSLITIQSFSL